ncbi:MAG: hypothetical protein CBD82_02065 [Gammaproteobacteria bacterium TMED222]|nr:MAG: hypothetical protein CBD82_02065 [Gammaproteobacteria bacterium TMED222]|tara:strand:+ start:354 stop:605 length:252 start_codon:yes stop_codon:yes gene_type:complete
MEILSAISIVFSIFSSLFVYDEAEFFAHKKKMQELYGPCSWEFVGKQSLDPTAKSIPFNPPIGEKFIFFKQVCENDPHRKDKD